MAATVYAATVVASVIFASPSEAAKRYIGISRQQGRNLMNSQSLGNSKVNIRVVMLNGANIMLGEPIVLHYTITNPSEYAIGTKILDVYDNEWQTLKMVEKGGSGGKAVTPIPDPRPVRPPGAISIRRPIIRPRQSREGHVVVTQYFAPARPGKYTLSFQVDMPYLAMDPSNPDLADPYSDALKNSGTAIKQTFTFPLTIRSGTPEGLRRVADGLRKKFTTTTDPEQQQMIADALFSMPPSATLPVWKRVAFDAVGTNRRIIARALGRTFKKEAADVLVKMQFSFPKADDTRSSFSLLKVLRDMSDYGNPELRKHVQDVLTPYRVDVAQIPRVAD